MRTEEFDLPAININPGSYFHHPSESIRRDGRSRSSHIMFNERSNILQVIRWEGNADPK